jgi:hypothetical protein
MHGGGLGDLDGADEGGVCVDGGALVDEFTVGEEEVLRVGDEARSAVMGLSGPAAIETGASGATSGAASDAGGVIAFGLAGLRVCGIGMELVARPLERRGRAMVVWVEGKKNRAVYRKVHSTGMNAADSLLFQR